MHLTEYAAIEQRAGHHFALPQIVDHSFPGSVDPIYTYLGRIGEPHLPRFLTSRHHRPELSQIAASPSLGQLEARQQRELLAQLREVERQHRVLTTEHSTLLREQEAPRQQLSEHQGRLSSESQRRAETELLLARAQARLEAIEQTVERLRSPASVHRAETQAHGS